MANIKNLLRLSQMVGKAAPKSTQMGNLPISSGFNLGTTSTLMRMAGKPR